MKRYIHTTLFLAFSQFKSLMRNYVYLFFMIGLPLLFLGVFGMLYSSPSTSSWKISVINETKDQPGKEISESILKGLIKTDENKDGVFEEKTYDTAEKREDALVRGEIDAIIKIPENFGEISSVGPTGQIEVIHSPDSKSAQIISGVLGNVLEKVDEATGRQKAKFTIKTTENSKKGLKNFDYVFAGMIAYTLMTFGLMGLSNAVPEDKKSGALKRIHASPVSPAQYLLAYGIAFFVMAIIAFTLMFAMAIYVFDWKMAGSWLNFVIFATLSLMMLFGTGLAIGGWAKDEKQASALSNVVMFPLMFLSGVFIPRFIMPEFLFKFTDFVPLTPVNDGIRLIVTENYELWQLLPQIGVIGVWMIILYAIAFKVFRWE